MNALTFRETQVSNYLPSGCLRKEIADKMGISLHTLDIHLARIRKKIGVQTTAQAGLYFAKNRG